jgi:signal transduction histidine kinase
MTDGTVHGARQEGTAWHRWHHMLAAALLFLTGTLFATVAWFHAVTLPDWLWLALVALASLALAARPPAAATLVETAADRDVRPVTAAPVPPPQVILAATTHELRTPLNAIIGFSELLRDAEKTGTARKQREEFATAILENAHHLKQRLDDVLDANRIASGSLKVAGYPVDIAEIIEVVSRDRHDAAAARNVSIVARIAGGITCLGDANRMRQALACVVDNAVAFSPPDGIVNINMLRGASGDLVVTVTDAGPGITSENAERAFEPFRQLDEGAARHHAGLGLGLYIARGILRLHDGDVTLATAPGSGTEVRLTFPSARVNWQAAHEYSPTVAAAHVA